MIEWVDMAVDSTDLGMPQDLAVTPDLADIAAMDGPAPATTLSLIAGGLGGSGNVDGTGPAARFLAPDGVAMDGAGNLYIADYGNDTIRKVVLATGAVSTLAGAAGQSGSTDGSGPAARFDRPSGVTADGAGNLYISEEANHTIRKVVLATGAVSTLAGTAGIFGSTDGTGSTARFYYPSGVAVDGAGNLYVVDSGNDTIRKVILATGAVTTLAGTAGARGSADGTGPAARFDGPQGVAADGAGNLYVADSENHTIRKVAVATGAVTTLAGTAKMTGSADGTGPTARFNYPYGVVLDGTGNLHVADHENQTIRKVVVATGAVTTLAGTAGMSGNTDGTGPAARFFGPDGMAVDGAGNLYVANFINDTIRKVVVATGAVTTLAGTARMTGSSDGTGPAVRFEDPQGVAADGAGNLYVADAKSTIRKVVVATGVVTTLAGTAKMYGSSDGTGPAARFEGPQGVAVDGAGNLYVTETNNSTIRKVVVATGAVTTLAGTAMVYGSADGTGPAARFEGPHGVAVDDAGNLYVADSGNHTIRKVVVATGAVTTLAGTAKITGSADGTGPTARFKYPYGVVLDGAGNLYVADSGNHTIRKVVVATGAVTTLAGTAGMWGSADGTGAVARFYNPQGVAVDGAGNLYVADTDNSTLRKILLSSGSVTTVVGVAGQIGIKLGLLPAGLNSPVGVAARPTGELFISDENSVFWAY